MIAITTAIAFRCDSFNIFAKNCKLSKLFYFLREPSTSAFILRMESGQIFSRILYFRAWLQKYWPLKLTLKWSSCSKRSAWKRWWDDNCLWNETGNFQLPQIIHFLSTPARFPYFRDFISPAIFNFFSRREYLNLKAERSGWIWMKKNWDRDIGSRGKREWKKCKSEETGMERLG